MDFIICIVSGYFLCDQYQRYNRFQYYLNNNSKPTMDSRMIFTGIIKSDESIDLFCKTIYRKRMVIDFISMNHSYSVLPVPLIKYVWDPVDKSYSDNLYLKINDTKLVLSPECIVHYTATKYDVNENFKSTTRFIPDSSTISVFGRITKDPEIIEAEIIGPKKKVLDTIARRYYGFSKTCTYICTIFLSISSVWMLHKRLYG